MNVFWSSLSILFKFCLSCHKLAWIENIVTGGALLIVKMNCIDGDESEWHSHPIVDSCKNMGNLLLSSSILYSGNTYKRIQEMMNMINVHFFSEQTFYNIQRSVLFPTLNYIYKMYRDKIIYDLKGSDLDLGGDGRCYSPGHCAKYGTYTLMEFSSNKIVDFQCVHVSQAGNSNNMEKKCFSCC